jgi:hypothetical protein
MIVDFLRGAQGGDFGEEHPIRIIQFSSLGCLPTGNLPASANL